MKTASILACVVPLAAATRNAAELNYALPKGLSAETSDCEFPGTYTIQNLAAAGTVNPAGNFTNVTEVAFSFVDSETGLASTCQMNSTSTNLSPGGAFAKYQCDSPDLEFSWGNTSATGMNYKVSVSETICDAKYEVAGSWIPTFTCKANASGEGVECTPSGNSTSYTVKFSSLNPVIG